jgi:hypothetical protein
MNRKEKIARAAGILEGEGSFVTKSNGHRPIIQCHMTDKDVVLGLQDLWGGHVYYCKPRKDGYRESWQWSIGGEEAVKVMNEIKPFMYSRRTEKINQVIKVWEDQKNKLRKVKENGDLAAKEYSTTGLSLRQAAKKYGVSYETVRRHLKNIN